MMHIGYGDSAADCLREAIEKHQLEGTGVVVSRDDFTQGPISECDDQMRTLQRPDYWTRVQTDVSIDMDVHALYADTLADLADVKAEDIIVWQGRSCHDILATAWLLTYYHERAINWWIVDLARLSPADLNGDRPPVNLAMFTPDQLASLYVHRQRLSSEGIVIYRELWEEMRIQNAAYRILDGAEIRSVDVGYHDPYILAQVPKEWTPMMDFVKTTLKNASGSISDLTIEWRLYHLIEEGKVDVRGDRSDMRACEIMLVT